MPRVVGLNVERFDQRFDNALTRILTHGGVACRSQLEPFLGPRRASKCCTELVDHGLARRLPFGWRRRVIVALKRKALQRHEFYYGAQGLTLPYRWTPSAARSAIARFEYALRVDDQRLVPLAAESLEAGFRSAAADPLRTLHGELDGLLRADARTSSQARRLDEIRATWVTSQTLRAITAELPVAGTFLHVAAGHLKVLFVDDEHSTRRYSELGRAVSAARDRLSAFVELSLEVLAGSGAVARRVSRLLADTKGARARNLGFDRYLIAPAELGRVFPSAEIRNHVDAILGSSATPQSCKAASQRSRGQSAVGGDASDA